jgi:hypothetical protein
MAEGTARARQAYLGCMGSRAGIAIAGAAAVVGLSTAIVVATDDSGSAAGSAARFASERGAPGRTTSVPIARRAPSGCPVTRSGWRPVRDDRTGRLWIAFGPTGGIYRVPAFNVAPDGSLGVKIAWQRGPGVRGPVTVVARNLDGWVPTVRRRIPTRGYGPTGLLASGIAFPTPGCWRVTATAGGARLTFVLLLRGPVTAGCDRRSMASFPGGFTSSRNLVVGPLALQGAGEPTPASVVREFGGNKFPLLVKAGHTVTLRVTGDARKVAGLAYAGLGKRPLPDGEVKLRDTTPAMTFVACRAGQRSGSSADGEPVTFWSGFVVLRRPACVPLEVQVDDEPAPRRAVIDMGGRDCG